MPGAGRSPSGGDKSRAAPRGCRASRGLEAEGRGIYNKLHHCFYSRLYTNIYIYIYI